MPSIDYCTIPESTNTYLVKANSQGGLMSRPEFAFLIEKLSTRAEGGHFIANGRITVFFSTCFGLIYLVI